MKLTKTELIALGWKYDKDVNKNCEIWSKDRLMLIWNRETLKVYML